MGWSFTIVLLDITYQTTYFLILAGQGPNLRRGWIPKFVHLVYWVVTGLIMLCSILYWLVSVGGFSLEASPSMRLEMEEKFNCYCL